MAYCSECGIYYTDDEAVCSSCGRNLKQEVKPETETTPTTKTNSPQSTEPTHFAATDEKGNNIELNRIKEILEQNNIIVEDSLPTQPLQSFVESRARAEEVFKSRISLFEDKNADSAYFQMDSHLGKGIIKPQKVELATDGVHFKYDTPSHNFIKAEPVKEKPREYRVTDSDMEVKTAENIYIAKEHLEDVIPKLQENGEEVTPLTTVTDVTEVTEVTKVNELTLGDEVGKFDETGEVRIPVEPKVLQKEYVPEIMTDEDAFLTYGPESIPKPVISDILTDSGQSESELIKRKERELVWEGTQTWFKIPLGKIYRLTGRYLIILGKYNNKLVEVDLAMITGVTVRQSWLAKLLGLGDLLISIPEFSATKIVLGGISKPNKVKLILEELCNSVNSLTIDKW